MKRWEQFNKIFRDENETVETQALGMVVSEIEERYGIEISLDYKCMFKDCVNWLDEEVEE